MEKFIGLLIHFRIIKGMFELSKGNLEVLEIVILRRSGNGSLELTNKRRSGSPTLRSTKRNSPTNISQTFPATIWRLHFSITPARPAVTRLAPLTKMALPAPTTLAVEDVLAFSDAELAQYMAGKRCPDGEFELDDIEGWESEKDRLAERLR